MRSSAIAGIAGVTAIVAAVSVAQSLAHAPPVAVTAEEIATTLRGKICTTRVGATFMFGPDGRYAYDGLWKSGGQYEIGDGIVTVTFDSGLERSFAMSRHGNVLYMEQTPLYCRTPEPVRS